MDEIEPYGIGDTPYTFMSYGIDKYPLMHGSTSIPGPTISHPPDKIMFAQTGGYTIAWIINSIFDNLAYTLTLNGSVVQSGSLNNSIFTFNIPLLDAGDYTLVLEITDPLGKVANDSVLLSVLSTAGREGSSSSSFFKNLDWTSARIGAGAGVVVIIIAAIVVKSLFNKPKKKKSSTSKKSSSKKKK